MILSSMPMIEQVSEDSMLIALIRELDDIKKIYKVTYRKKMYNQTDFNVIDLVPDVSFDYNKLQEVDGKCTKRNDLIQQYD